MKYAVDHFKIGFEEEVSADDLYGITHIPQRKTRFFCPECGEPVFWRKKGGSQPNMFCHFTRTKNSPECDKRVDGRSELNLYQRVGLPIILSRIRETHFRLYFLFPAIGEPLLDSAVKDKSRIYVTGANLERSFPIDYTYFQATSATKIPIDFTPNCGEDYFIRIDARSDIKKKWSDYSDGIEPSGAIFTYSETGGKRIRRGDSISPGRHYYLIAEDYHSPYDEINATRVGSIQLNQLEWTVYAFSITVSIDEDFRYAEIVQYLNIQFGISLLETMPELIPLWPPVTEQDVLVPIKNTSAIYCAISSGNSVPKVYTYLANNVTSLEINQDKNGVNTISLPITQETIVSVDRKYVGRELVFKKKPISLTNHAYDITLENQEGVVVDLETLTSTILSSGPIIKSNAKIELYIGSQDKTYVHIPIRAPITPIPTRRNSTEILLVVDNSVLQNYDTKSISSTYSSEQDLLRLINENCKGEYVPVPRWVGILLVDWQRDGHYILVSKVKRMIYNRNIPNGLLKMLLVAKVHHKKK